MITLPVLELDGACMRFNDFGRLQFCENRQEAVVADFAVTILADDADNWEISDILMGTQRLSGNLRRHFATEIEIRFHSAIHDHIAEHLPDAEDEAAFERANFREGRS
jgi:hypothetical protein